MTIHTLRSAIVLFASSFALTFGAAASAQIQFEDVSDQVGFTGFTESWGAAWGDLNNDNWPDLFNQGHRDYPRAYRNTGEGTFQDIAYEIDPGNWIAYPLDDKHGASFADYDNDGDDDLLIGVSSTGPGIFMVNEYPVFTDRADEADLRNDAAARLPVWFDADNDGHLDVAQVHTDNSYLRRRDWDEPSATGPWDFDGFSGTAGFSCAGQLNYAQLIDINGDGSLELMCVQEGSFPVRVWDTSTLPFTDVTSSVPSLGNTNNSIVADLNGDLLYDMVVTRGTLRPSGASLAGPNRIEAWLRKDDAQSSGKGFYFESNGEITVAIDHRGMGIYESSKVYTLSPTGQTVADAGPVSVRWEASENRWRAKIDTGGTMQTYIQIDTVVPVTNLIEDQFDFPEFAIEPYYFENGPSGLEAKFTNGLYVPMHCGGLAAEDFDNDMDVDIYMVCRRGAENLANRLFENQGDGTFIEKLSFGGEGPTGVGFSFGVGDAAVTADYDVDGFMDIYLANGLLYYPIGEGGPDSLLRNLGNSNNWIEIDLRGTTSNRDGVGAKVYVTAGGKTQLREANGGYHRWSQNHRRLHFGLAGNTTADITVEWPSGATDTYTAVAANALYEATEGGAIVVETLGPPVYTELTAGDECGEPPYDLDYGPAVLMWKDCGSDVWSLRAKGGRFTAFKQFTSGQITADSAFSSVSGVSLDGQDNLDNSNPNILEFAVGAWFSNSKGFDFSTAGQTQSCFDPTTMDIDTLIVGGNRKRITGSFDLISLGECVAPPEPDPECGDPQVSGPDDFGVFVWKDCDYVGPDARWNVTIGGGGSTWAGYAGAIYSDAPLTATGNSLEGNDTLDTVAGDNEMDFILFVGGTGVDGFQIDVPAGSQTCFVPEFFTSGKTYFRGADRLPVTGNFDMLTLEGTCEAPPPPPADPGCGDPGYDAVTENAIFLWRDCNAAGDDQQWKIRVTGGSAPWGPYEGTITSSATLAPTPFSLEASDTLDSVPGDGVVDFIMKVGGTGQDGFNVTIPAGADACFDMSLIQNGAQIIVGQDRDVFAAPFDLTTLGACN